MLPPEIIERARVFVDEVKSGKREMTPFSQLPPIFREMNERMIRSYDAAITNQFNRDQRGTYGSANAEVLAYDYTARARARHACSNEPHAKGILRTMQNNVVGHRPFRLKMRLGTIVDRDKPTAGGIKKKFKPESDTNTQIELEYEKAGRPENFTVRQDMSRMEAFRVMEASAFRDGRILMRDYWGYEFNDYKYAVDILECDHLDQNYMGKAPVSGNPIRFSIEYHPKYNFKLAFWLLTRHPGDPFGAPSWLANTWRERVDADEIILYNNLRDRAEQDIGMTEMDSIMQYLHRIKQYEISLTLAAIGSCCKQWWIKKNFPTGMTYTTEDVQGWVGQYVSQITGPIGTNGTGQNSGTVAKQQQIGTRSTTDAPATTLELPYGEELMQTDPKFPIEASVGFRKNNLESVGVGVGIAYQDIAGDYQNLGFSASRACSLPMRDNFKVRQQNFIDVVVRPHFRKWMKAAITSGVFDFPISRLDEIVNAAKFQGVRWPFVNPLQDIQATILQLEAGLISPQQVQDELEDGVSIEDLYTMLEEANELQEAHGLQYGESDVTRPTISKGEPGQTIPKPGDDAQPPPKTRPANPVRARRRRGEIDDTTGRLLAMQEDGRNGFGH